MGQKFYFDGTTETYKNVHLSDCFHVNDTFGIVDRKHLIPNVKECVHACVSVRVLSYRNTVIAFRSLVPQRAIINKTFINKP